MVQPPLFPKTEGKTSKQAHTDLPEGTVELERGRKGFFGRVSHLYKTNAPTAWTKIEGELRPRAFSLSQVDTADRTDPAAPYTTVLYNNECRISISKRAKEMPYYFRNSDGDETLFIHVGKGVFESDYGNLEYQEGDYIVIPRGTSYRLVPYTEDNFYLFIEATDSAYEFPDRGMLGPNAQIDPAMIETPTIPETITRENEEWEVKIKRWNAFTSYFFPHNPVQDTIGWQGTNIPMKFSIDDFRPVASEHYHLPPSVHTTLTAPSFVICSFVPRPLEDPSVLRIPFYHSNIEYDEVIFYHDGEFFSRHGIDRANITYHPGGIEHGPQPEAFEKVQNNAEVTRTNEKAVMIDTRKPLFFTDEALQGENVDYWKSWKEIAKPHVKD
ncbi:MAG: homogentisate 1,2-dioxygenase [Candidatus Kariarchaeaceae archaeon]|jgi:homogentisate 1,2-dioxygenase